MKKEILEKIKDIHSLYAMPRLAQNMHPEHYAIVEYEKLIYEQYAKIDKLESNWKELKEWLDEQNFDDIDTLMVSDKMYELESCNNDRY